ncbi:MAG: PDZ domain-containing protein [Clostridia bacterium]|nr:PDZ domain-containing protein [Clostridia bacterium]
MKKLSKKIIATVLGASIGICSALPAFAESAQPAETLESSYVKAIVDSVAERYRFNADKELMYEAVIDYVIGENPELLEGAIAAATSGLDQFSGYMDRETLSGFGDYISQNYVGIGVEITREPGYLEVAGVMMGSPAEAAGFKVGDKIIAIDGEDATGFSVDMAASKVRGEKGTQVAITVLRDGQKITLVANRDAVSASTLHYAKLEHCGYIKISQFNASTPMELEKALAYFDNHGTKKLIFDVRDNPGGELLGLLRCLYQLVPQDKLLTSIDYNGEDQDISYYSKAKFKTTDRKIVVLINKNSASAAELFAGAIRYNGLGVLMGERSHGKGTVQEFMGLRSMGGLKLGDIKLTVAEYSLPNGEFIHKKGLEPDIPIENKLLPLVSEDFKPITFEAKFKLGDSGESILAIKQRLDALGYQVGEVNDVFDKELELATYSFQQDAGLYPYGVMDITTQNFLNNVADKAKVLKDLQLDAAVAYFKEKAVK